MDFAMHWLWLTIGVVLCAFEALAPGMFMLWLGIAAIVTGVVVFLAPLTVEWSLLLFCLLALLSVATGRKFYGAQDKESDKPFLNRRADAMIGQIFTLESAIADGEGRIRYHDSVWRVQGPDLPAGTRVRVTGVADPTLLKVEAVSG